MVMELVGRSGVFDGVKLNSVGCINLPPLVAFLRTHAQKTKPLTPPLPHFAWSYPYASRKTKALRCHNYGMFATRFTTTPLG